MWRSLKEAMFLSERGRENLDKTEMNFNSAKIEMALTRVRPHNETFGSYRRVAEQPINIAT
jgi:hypothetical protein